MRIPPLARYVAGHFARWRGVVCLNYHRIGDGSRSLFDRQVYSATRDGFDRQVRWLKRHFDVISPKDLEGARALRRGRHVIVTFDDGYRDNYTDAFAVLKSHGVPATFFVAVGFIDEPRLPWWDEIAWMVRTSKRASVSVPDFPVGEVVFDEPDRERAITAILRAYKRLPDERTAAFVDAIAEATGSGRASSVDARPIWMTWDMIREMKAAGMTIGGHTVRHCVLARLARDEQEKEIDACARRLREELDVSMDAFAYPVGTRDAFDQTTKDVLREKGVRVAFSYYGGVPRLRRLDPYDVPRIPIEADTTFRDFEAILMFPWRTY